MTTTTAPFTSVSSSATTTKRSLPKRKTFSSSFFRGARSSSSARSSFVVRAAASSSSGEECADEDKNEKNCFEKEEEEKEEKLFTLDSEEYALLSESMRSIESQTKELRHEYNKMVIKAMQTPRDFIEWNERNGYDKKGESIAEKRPKREEKPTGRKETEDRSREQREIEAKKRKEELDERIRKTDDILKEKMNASSILPEGFIQKMSKVLGDQNALFSSVEEIFEKRLGEEMYKKYIEEKRQKAAEERRSKISNVALVNLNCVEDFLPLFVLVFHHGQDSPEQAGIYSLQEKATPEELPVDTILAFMTREDAERYAKLLKSSLGTIPIVESVTKSELLLTCRVGGHRCVVSNKGYELAPPKESLRVTDWERSNMLRSGAWRVVGEDETCTISEDDLELDWKTQGMEMMASYREAAKRERLENARERLERLYRQGTLGKNEDDNTDPDNHSK
jgi:hypothetical protein